VSPLARGFGVNAVAELLLQRLQLLLDPVFRLERGELVDEGLLAAESPGIAL
jgi:hypothetical protein